MSRDSDFDKFFFVFFNLAKTNHGFREKEDSKTRYLRSTTCDLIAQNFCKEWIPS